MSRRGARIIAKSKSLTTEEIDLNQPLIEAGIDVVETDLGELIIQLAGEKPFHLVFPSIHKMAPEVAEIFSRTTGQAVADDIPSIMKVVRTYLRPIFLKAEIGLTGANVGIAETGGICIETNEGNARLVSSLKSCHICLIGMEKIVETIEDALLMVLAHPVSASGQLPTNYVTWMHGRSPLGEGAAGEERESHIIILDNGRTAMRGDADMREALYCIRCGAYINICPTYGVVGGHTFGLKGGLLGYDLSQAVGQPLFDLFTASGVDAIVTESSVCSIQLAEGTAMPVYHPLDLLNLV